MAEGTRTDLQERIVRLTMESQEKIKELNKKLNERDKDIIALKQEADGMRRNAIINVSDKDKIKKVLQFRAQLMSVSTIYDKMKYLGFQCYVEEINEIIKNIDCLEPDMQQHYNEACKVTEDGIKINNSTIKQTLVSEYQQLLDSVSVDLMKLQDSDDDESLQLKITLRKEKKDILNSISNFSKNIDNTILNEENNSIIRDMEDEYEKNKANNIVRFDRSWLEKVKVI